MVSTIVQGVYHCARYLPLLKLSTTIWQAKAARDKVTAKQIMS